MHLIKLFIATLIVYILLDTLWLGVFAKHFYTQALSHLMRPSGKINLYAAVIVYALMVIGILFFVIPKSDGFQSAFLFGALFGFILYGVYDFTNYALLATWPLRVLLLDITWGTLLSALTSTFAWWIQT